MPIEEKDIDLNEECEYCYHIFDHHDPINGVCTEEGCDCTQFEEEDEEDYEDEELEEA